MLCVCSVFVRPVENNDFVFYFYFLVKSSKVYKKSFDGVLSGQYEESLPTLLQHLKLMDSSISRPLREYNDCQEAIKQCYSALGNSYSRSKPNQGGKKDKDSASMA